MLNAVAVVFDERTMEAILIDDGVEWLDLVHKKQNDMRFMAIGRQF